MLKFILNRLLMGCVVIFSLFTITFFLIKKMPGDPFTKEKAQDEQSIERLRELFNLDGSVWSQYTRCLTNYSKGELGRSIHQNIKISRIIKESFPHSALLGLLAMCVAIAIGIPLGIFAALKQNSLLDYTTMLVALCGISIPAFVIGPLLAVFIGGTVPFFNVAGWSSPQDMVLPAFTLGVGTAAALARITRTGMLEVLNQDYIRTAKAKGVSPFNIIKKHAIRGGILPAISYIGPAFAFVLTGSFVVETIFQIPGMGQHFVNSTSKLDPFLLQGMVTVLGILIVLANLTTDIAMAFLNPRLRESI